MISLPTAARLGFVAAAVLSLGLGACSSDEAKSSTPAPAQPFEPEPVHLRLLLARQYRASIRDLLGDAAALAASPPGDVAVSGYFSVGASQIALGDSAIADYEASARAVAAAAFGDAGRIDALAGCTPASASDADCARELVTKLGRMVFRRPLEDAEIDTYTAVATETATQLGDAYAGAQAAVAALLESPSFLYRDELGEDDGSGAPTRTLGPYELATRMSFFLLDATPPPALLDEAASGALDTEDGTRKAALELLALPEARDAVAARLFELFRLDELDTLSKTPAVYPAFSADLAASMKTEARMFIDDIVWDQNADFRDLLTSDHTFVDTRLAALYGLPAVEGTGFTEVTLPADQDRAGLLGLSGLLAVFAHPDSTSPTLRGKMVRERLLCQSIPPPPPGVVTALPSGATGTMRQRLESHRSVESCAGCHAQMDPVGLAMEGFDGIGAHRDTENGLPIDTSGDLSPFGEFTGVRELGRLLHDRPEIPACVVRNLFRDAVGHLEGPGEEPALADLTTSFTRGGYKLRDLLVDVVASEAFRTVGVDP